MWVFQENEEDDKNEDTYQYPFCSTSLNKLKKEIAKYINKKIDEEDPEQTEDGDPNWIKFGNQRYRPVYGKYDGDVYGWIKKVPIITTQPKKYRKIKHSPIDWGRFEDNSSSREALFDFIAYNKSISWLMKECWSKDCKEQVKIMKRLGAVQARELARRAMNRRGYYEDDFKDME